MVRLKHAETGGYITIDESSKEKNALQEAYVRVYKGVNEDEQTTTNQLFEVEMCKDSMEESGAGLQWQEDPETGSMICPVHLRHFNSGRLVQVTYFKDLHLIG